MTNEPRELISVWDAAQRFSVREQSIYRAIRRGTIQPAEGEDVPPGRWFEVSEVARWVASCRVKPGRPVTRGKAFAP